MNKNNLQKGGFIYESHFLPQDNPNFNLINTEITAIKNANKNIYNNETMQFYEEPTLNKIENLLLLQEIKSYEIENLASVLEEIDKLIDWKLKNTETENERKLKTILEIRRYYESYNTSKKPAILNLLIKEIKKIYPAIEGSDEEIVSMRNWQGLTLEPGMLSSPGGGGGGGGEEAALLQIIQLRKETDETLSRKKRQLALIKPNISKIDVIIQTLKKSTDEIFKPKDLNLEPQSRELYNSKYDEYFRTDASLLELIKKYKSVFSNIVPIYKDEETLQFFPFLKSNYRIFLGTYGVHIWEIYSHATARGRIGLKGILMDFNFKITHEIEDTYRERFVFSKKPEDYIYFLKVNKNVNVLEYHLLNTKKNLLPELFIFYKKFYGNDFMNWFNLYAILTESNQILYHQKPNIMTTFILSNSIHLLIRIYKLIDVTVETYMNPEAEKSKPFTMIIDQILNPDNFKDIKDIDDNYAYIDSILNSIKSMKFQSEVHKIFFVLKKIGINKTFKLNSLFLFINYLLQPDKRDEVGQEAVARGGQEAVAGGGGASSSSSVPVGKIRINLPQEDRIRIREELIIILHLINTRDEVNLQETDIIRLVHSYNFLGINAKYIESIGWLNRNKDTFYQNIKELNILIKLSFENVRNLLFINLLEEAYYYKCLKARISPVAREKNNFIEVIFMFFYFNNLNTNVILKNLTNLNLQLFNLLDVPPKDYTLNKDGVINFSIYGDPEEKLIGRFYKTLYFNADYLIGLKFMDYQIMRYKFNDPRKESRITNTDDGRPMCGEVTIMNFLNSMLWNATSNKLDITYFPDTTKPELVEFYRKNEANLSSFNTKPIYEEFFNLLKNIPLNLNNYELIPLPSTTSRLIRDYGDKNLKTPYRYYDLRPGTQIINEGVELRLSYYNMCRVLSYLLNLSDELSFDNIQRLNADGDLVLIPESSLKVGPETKQPTAEEIARAEMLAGGGGGGGDRAAHIQEILQQILADRPAGGVKPSVQSVLAPGGGGAAPAIIYSTFNKFTLKNIIDKFKNPNKLKFTSNYELTSESNSLYAVYPITEVEFNFFKFSFGAHSSEVFSGAEKQDLKFIMFDPNMGDNIYKKHHSADIGQAFYQSRLRNEPILHSISYKNCPDSQLINFFNTINEEQYISQKIMIELIYASKIDVLYFIFEKFNIYDKKIWIKFIMILLDKNLKESYEKYIRLYLKLVKRDKFNTKELTVLFFENFFGGDTFMRDRFDKIHEFLNIKDMPFISSFIQSKIGRDFIDYIYTKISDDDFNSTTLKFLFYATGDINYDRLFSLVKSNKLNFNDIFAGLDFSNLLDLQFYYDFNFVFDYDKIIAFFRDTDNEKYLWKGGLIFRNLIKNQVFPPHLDNTIKLLAFIIKKILNNIKNEQIPKLKIEKEILFRNTFTDLLLELLSNEKSIKRIGPIPFRKMNTVFDKIKEVKDKLKTEADKTAYENTFIDLQLIKDEYLKFCREHNLKSIYGTEEPIRIQMVRFWEHVRLPSKPVSVLSDGELHQKYLKYKNKYLLLKKLKI